MPQRRKFNDIIADFSALIVEDEPIVALDLELLLKSLGATRVRTTSRTDEARKLISSEDFDICLLDYHLDDGTSGAVAKLILDAKLPFIFMSGDMEFIVKLRDIDHLNTLEKPFSHKQVKLAVARGLGTVVPESARD